MTPVALRPFFNQLGIEYLESNRYLPPSLASRNVKRTYYYRHNVREFDELAVKYGGSLRTGEGLSGLEIRHIGGLLGYGLFTLDALSPGDLVGEYLGIVRPARPGRPLSDGGYTTDYAWGFPEVRTLGRKLEIDARKAGGPLRFANHTADANTEPDHFPFEGQWHLVFVARQNIAAGEEITINYGEGYWSEGYRELVGA
jgi:hypothetical protein